MMTLMKSFARHLQAWLEQKGLSAYKLAKLSGLHEQHLYKITRGDRRPTDDVLRLFASLPELDISLELLMAWRVIDDYSSEAIEKAHAIIVEGAASAKGSGRAGASGTVIPPPTV